MADLPEARVTKGDRPFLICGVDICGPFFVHRRGRGSRTTIMYLAVFVCFTSKAVHLELVEDLTTAAFLNTLERFMNRRGLVHTIWSDNATNFLGASRELERLRELFESKQHWTTVYEP